ncbi:hypothetical protein [Spirosoma sp. KNUC1025]|uniref:hypothetical protein n=1 Tax=Spirosoma sp. KNUC1025 TaxID=2894082 RepID=UPI0038654A64|nr:hypothetical protein LN737_19220 [Spirosoma sp. KNUC1025]
MQIKVDSSSLKPLMADLRRVGRALDFKTLGAALVGASKPAVRAVQQEAPVGHDGHQRVSLSRSRGRRNDYRRGGATRQDVRAKAVDGVGKEEVRVLIGVSKKRGKVGWRTHFITVGTIRMRANAFIDRGVNRVIDQVKSSFMGSLITTVQRIVKRASK